MSDVDATEALLARLSYTASVRAGEAARRAATKFPIFKVAQIALTFCILVSILNYPISRVSFQLKFLKLNLMNDF